MILPDWPLNPIATMIVDNFQGGTHSVIPPNVVMPHQTVFDINIDFRVEIEFHDHPYFDHARGYFSVQLEKMTGNGWQLVESLSKTLENNSDDGDWYDSTTVADASPTPPSALTRA